MTPTLNAPVTTLRLHAGQKLVAATHNPGKAKEIAALLEGRVEVIAAGALNLPEPDETETTFVGNAVLKARHAADASGLVALADDSGLSVRGLKGAPGIFSARWGGPQKDFAMAAERIKAELAAAGVSDLHCHFTCALALAFPDGPVLAVEGKIEGELNFPPRGERGFGYDPIFRPYGFEQTFAEMDPAKKEAMSHRARAFEQLKALIF